MPPEHSTEPRSGEGSPLDTTILDANAVLRFLLGDIAEQAAVTKQTIARRNCLIPVEVTAEIVYVLYGWYKLPREKIAAKIRELISAKPGLVEKSDLVFCAAALFEANPRLDFVDCLLAGYQRLFACNIVTFDKDLQKQLSGQNQ